MTSLGNSYTSMPKHDYHIRHKWRNSGNFPVCLSFVNFEKALKIEKYKNNKNYKEKRVHFGLRKCVTQQFKKIMICSIRFQTGLLQLRCLKSVKMKNGLSHTSSVKLRRLRSKKSSYLLHGIQIVLQTGVLMKTRKKLLNSCGKKYEWPYVC